MKHACSCSTFHFNSLTLAYFGNLSSFCRLLIFFQNQFVCCFFLKKYFGNISRVSSSLDQDQAQRFVVPDLGPNCLHRLSDDTSK